MNNYYPTAHSLKIPLIDNQIPFWSFMVIPYILYLPYVFFTTLVYPFYSKNYKWFVLSLVFSQILAGLIYYLYQTTITRPDVIGADIFSELVRLVYNLDKPYNCFPSLHTALTVIFSYFWLKEDIFRRSKLLSAFLIVFSLSILASTVLIKQHYFIDILGGVVLAIFATWAAKYCNRYFTNKSFISKV
jgi:membrane-associated phospholipid phosphatase